MAGKAAGAAKGGIRAWLMPEINDIKVQLAEMRGDIKATNTRIDSFSTDMRGDIKSLNTRIDEMDKRLTENDRRLSEKIDDLDKRLSEKIDDLDKRLDIAQRLAIVEAKVKEQESKR
jgi:predicted nuclease with TOPRIM domain